MVFDVDEQRLDFFVRLRLFYCAKLMGKQRAMQKNHELDEKRLDV